MRVFSEVYLKKMLNKVIDNAKEGRKTLFVFNISGRVWYWNTPSNTVIMPSVSTYCRLAKEGSVEPVSVEDTYYFDYDVESEFVELLASEEMSN